MSDSSSIQEKESGGQLPSPQSCVMVDRQELFQLVRQASTARNLAAFAQNVSIENEKVKHRNNELEKQVLNQNFKSSQPVKSGEHGNESMSLPLDLDAYGQSLVSGKPASSAKSFGFRFPETAVGQAYVKEDSSAGWKSLQTKQVESANQQNEIVESSLRVDGDPKSIVPLPQDYFTEVEGRRTVTSAQISPTLPHESGVDSHVSVFPESLPKRDETGITVVGVSTQYFDLVVKELAKTKLLLKRLMKQKGGSPKDILNALNLKQMADSLENENSKLKKENLHLRSLMVSEVNTEAGQSQGNKGILRNHDKVSSAVEAQPGRTEDQGEGQKTVSKDTTGLEVTANEDSIIALQKMVTSLTHENQSFQQKIRTLATQNQKLEEQLSEQVSKLRQSQNVQELRDLVQGLTVELENSKKVLKARTDEINYLKYQVQSSQKEIGEVNKQKANLQTQMDEGVGRERQLKAECDRLSNELSKALTEIESMQQKLSPNIARVQPVLKQVPGVETFLPSMSKYKQGQKDIPGWGSEHVLSDYTDPVLLKTQQRGEYLCEHCLRCDFSDDHSFDKHKQKCGD